MITLNLRCVLAVLKVTPYSNQKKHELVECQFFFSPEDFAELSTINKIINSQKIVNTDYSRCFPSHSLWHPTQIGYQRICRLVSVLHITLQF